MSAEPLPRLFLAGDYPPEALKNQWEGDVVADLTIDPDGHVAKCTIARSSGHDVLDEKTCEVLKARARFTPAQAPNGHGG
jgi:protein TonB